MIQKRKIAQGAAQKQLGLFPVIFLNDSIMAYLSSIIGVQLQWRFLESDGQSIILCYLRYLPIGMKEIYKECGINRLRCFELGNCRRKLWHICRLSSFDSGRQEKTSSVIHEIQRELWYSEASGNLWLGTELRLYAWHEHITREGYE